MAATTQVRILVTALFLCHDRRKKQKAGLVRDLNPGPLAPKARIIPLDQRAMPSKARPLGLGNEKRKQTDIYLGNQDEVAEWLRRWTANPMGIARVGSNPILIG